MKIPWVTEDGMGHQMHKVQVNLKETSCPQCNIEFSSTNRGPILDSCGHNKCRLCFMSNEHCPQCILKLNEKASPTLEEIPPLPNLFKDQERLILSHNIRSPLGSSGSPHSSFNDSIEGGSQSTTSIEVRISGSDDNAPNTSRVLDKEEIQRVKKKRNRILIQDHITIISTGKEGAPTMYQCNSCKKEFKTKAHIKYHEFCQNGEKPFKCPICTQGFVAKSHYEYHLRTHTGEKPFKCPKCGKGFNQRGQVTRHLRSHTGEKPFLCQICGRGFANAQALRAHNLVHTGERPYACQFCEKRFTGMTNLKKHEVIHTGERPHTCQICQKSFGLKWTLDLHIRTHSSDRPYACDQCSRAFSNSKDLRRHLVIHSGERPFPCWICGTSFRRKDNLDRHIKNTHNQPRDPRNIAKHLANISKAALIYRTSQASKYPVKILPRPPTTGSIETPPSTSSSSTSPTSHSPPNEPFEKQSPREESEKRMDSTDISESYFDSELPQQLQDITPKIEVYSNPPSNEKQDNDYGERNIPGLEAPILGAKNLEQHFLCIGQANEGEVDKAGDESDKKGKDEEIQTFPVIEQPNEILNEQSLDYNPNDYEQSKSIGDSLENCFESSVNEDFEEQKFSSVNPEYPDMYLAPFDEKNENVSNDAYEDLSCVQAICTNVQDRTNTLDEKEEESYFQTKKMRIPKDLDPDQAENSSPIRDERSITFLKPLICRIRMKKKRLSPLKMLNCEACDTYIPINGSKEETLNAHCMTLAHINNINEYLYGIRIS